MVTFHNQRDFIFIRHHRYVYRQEEDTQLANQRTKAEIKKGINSKKTSRNALKEQRRRAREEAGEAAEAEEDAHGREEGQEGLPMKTRARLQELGPRFTLKLKWLQEGLLDTQFGEYEWVQGKRNQMKRNRRKFFL